MASAAVHAAPLQVFSASGHIPSHHCDHHQVVLAENAGLNLIDLINHVEKTEIHAAIENTICRQ